MIQIPQQYALSSTCGLIGRKLGHSYSQSVHQQLGRYSYQLIELEPHQLEPFLMNKNFRGLNVTIPYKETVLPYLDFIDPLAQRIGSINTILNDKGRLKGYNTDYLGFDYLLTNHRFSLKDKRILILGSGGSAKMLAIYAQDKDCQWVKHLSIRHPYPKLSKSLKSAQVIINATPVGMYPNNHDLRLNLDEFTQLEGVIDLIYNPLRTALVLEAKKRGLKAMGGLDMLIAQAFFASQFFTDQIYAIDQLDQVCQSYRQKIENLIFIGMPGVGKTTLGEKLAKQLNRPFIDTDQLIEAEIQQSIAEYLPKVGEKAFRNLEETIIQQVAKEKGQVIATGGGAILRTNNRQALRQNGRLILLDRPLEELSRQGRPLSSSLDQIKSLWNERKAIYQGVTDLTITVTPSLSTTYQVLLERLINHEIISN